MRSVLFSLALLAGVIVAPNAVHAQDSKSVSLTPAQRFSGVHSAEDRKKVMNSQPVAVQQQCRDRSRGTRIWYRKENKVG